MLILDCSAAMELTRGTTATLAIQDAIRQTDFILAPDFFKVEVASVYRKCVKAGQLSSADAVEKARAAVDMVDDFVAAGDFYVEALSESIRLDHSTYDMFYFLLARRTSSRLATMDKALGRLCAAEGIATVGWDCAG